MRFLLIFSPIDDTTSNILGLTKMLDLDRIPKFKDDDSVFMDIEDTGHAIPSIFEYEATTILQELTDTSIDLYVWNENSLEDAAKLLENVMDINLATYIDCRTVYTLHNTGDGFAIAGLVIDM